MSTAQSDDLPYEIIVASASRPHLLSRVLTSLFQHVDQVPARLIVHDDAAFPGRLDAVQQTVFTAPTAGTPVVFEHADPPISHGPSLYRLLMQARAPYVLYSQDDHFVERALPVHETLAVMDEYDLHQVRFNKRPTMEWKAFWQKIPFTFAAKGRLQRDLVLTVADHWYFQTGLWRTDRIRAVVRWWMEGPFASSFHEHCEVKINRTFNRQMPEFNQWQKETGIVVDMPPSGAEAMDQQVRARVQRTFIYGPPGEDRYVFHIGGEPEDWALWRPRGGVGVRDTQ